MSDAIFIANKASGHLAIGDKKEMDKATWRKPRGIRLTPTSLRAPGHGDRGFRLKATTVSGG
jgi:hypothetical protein